MTFDRILDDGRLWAVRYDEKEDNCFEELFGQWYDMQWLKSFFSENITDLESFFHITDVYEAVMETIEDASRLECLMLDITPDANLDILFRHLENYRFSEMSLGRKRQRVRALAVIRLGLEYMRSRLRLECMSLPVEQSN